MGRREKVPEGAILEVLKGEKTQSEVAREWGVSRQAVSERVWKIEGMPERVKRVPAELPVEPERDCPAEDTAIIDGGIDNELDLSDFCLEL